ncbi:MAG: SUMF1/EgtB/PvdO family nonheme iron enzyme, partial [Planctomycetales bacterium]
MNEKQRFLAEIAADPANDAARLVFADWLEERGDLRADLLRLLTELLHLVGPADCLQAERPTEQHEVPDRAAKEARLRELLYERDVLPIMPTRVNSIGMRFAQIPPGEFLMGAPDDEEGSVENERPRRPVTIAKPFWLGVYPVTQGEFESVTGTNPSWFSRQGDSRYNVAGRETHRFPVEQVSWANATKFCQRLSDQESASGCNYRLPTEAEWDCAKKFG